VEKWNLLEELKHDGPGCIVQVLPNALIVVLNVLLQVEMVAGLEPTTSESLKVTDKL